MDENIKAYVVYVSFLELKMTIHLVREVQMILLLAEEVIVSAKYSDFANVFLEESANISSKRKKVKKYAIKLEKSKQPRYKPI